jgi:trehalose 6-phosphate phosphatase
MDLRIATPHGRAGVAAIRADPSSALVAFDYDGTLAPIVGDPSRAVPHPEVTAALRDLAAYVGRLAVVTGRPAQVAVQLAGLDSAPGLERLAVVGHYGLERWDAESGKLSTVEPPAGLATVRAELPGLLESLGLSGASVEDKGLSVAVHVRGLADPQGAFDRLQRPLVDLAERCGLASEPGKRVIELRPPGMNKGQALRKLVEEFDARAVAFFGDDLGDLAAFDEVDRLRGVGVPGLLICSGSAEESALVERADLVVDGPAGVVAFLRDLVEQLSDRG